MSSRVSVSNKSFSCFKASTVLFSEIENNLESFWKSKNSVSILATEEEVIFGKLIRSSDLPNSANFVASIMLSCETERSQESFIILKSRIKNSKTGIKVYAYVSSFPENLSVTKSHWCKGTAKNTHLANIFGKIIQVTYKISWNDNVSFLIEQLPESPMFFNQLQSANEEIIDDYYENQWKKKSNFTHISIRSCYRPPYSTVNGDRVLPKSQIMPPTPLWIWIDDWHLDNFLDTQDGWIYSDDWKSSKTKEQSLAKFRFRRWIRTRTLKKNISDKSNNLEFILESFHLSVNMLQESLPPFLREIKKEVIDNPCGFDMCSLTAIPSPRLRRELQIFNM